MSPDVNGASTIDSSPSMANYKLVLLNKAGDWTDVQDILAFDDVEAISICKFLADEKPFELWLGICCVAIFSGMLH